MYFQTPDADATQKTTESAGGTVRLPAFDVMDAGRMAALTDPGGAQFAVWQPGTTKGLERTSATNTLVWAELHVADPESVLAFYRTLFGWRWAEMEAPGMTYRVISTADGDQEDASFGGVAELQGRHRTGSRTSRSRTPTRWPARPRATAARSSSPAADIPDVGRIAWLADPFGAPFAVLKPAPMG